MTSSSAAIAENGLGTTSWRTGKSVPNRPDDERELIERYLPLVRNVVDRIRFNLPAHVDVDDLHSAGVTGLIAAVHKYNPSQDNTFAAYATMRIRGAILDELRRLDWCPRRARAKARKIKDAINEIEQATGSPASDQEIRQRLGLSTKEFGRWMEDARPVTFVAIDGPVDEDRKGASLHDVIADENNVLARENMEHDELLQLVAQKIQQLPDTPRKILAMYYFEHMRLAEIAAVFGLTESRICQIHSQTVLALRASLQRQHCL
ncbi:MAG: FliA/WhiG family RNA polymerase sigma factor [Polyangia bacterium]